METNPFAVLAQVLPHAQNEDELATLAAQIAPPPPENFKPVVMPTGQQMAGPRPGVGATLAAPKSNGMVPPPKTQGESRTSIGAHILGLGG